MRSELQCKAFPEHCGQLHFGGGVWGGGGGARGVCGSTIGFHLLWDTVELAMSTRLCLL